MSTQVDLFTNVEPTSVSPAIAKPFVSRSCGQIKKNFKQLKTIKMYTIITFYIIGYFFFLYVLYKDFDGFDGFVIFFPLIQSLLFALAGLIIGIALPIKYETTSWTENIVTLKDNNTTSGRFFFLGSGIIEGRMKYVFYLQNNDSTYQMAQADYYDAKIRYVNTQPKVVITDKHWAKTTFNKWAIDMADESRQTYIFEVPQGSIKNSYELDAQ